MMGYLNKPKSAYFDDEGFGMTGDIGYYTESGVVFYVDRVKEIIKSVQFRTAGCEKGFAYMFLMVSFKDYI